MFEYIAGYALSFGALCVALCLPGMAIGPSVWKSGLRELRFLIAISLGLTAWIVLAFALAATRQVRLLSFLALCVVWLLLALLRLSRSGRTRVAVTRPRLSAQSVLCFLILVVLLAPCFLLSLGPLVKDDPGTYHLTLPKLYIAHAGFRPVAFNVYSNWPLNIELLFMLAMLVKDHVLAALVHLGFGLLVLFEIDLICRTFHRSRSAWLAMILFLASPVVLWEMTVAFVDLAYAFFLLAAFVFLEWAWENRPGRRVALLLAGICCGVVAGIKVNGVTGVIVLFALALWRLPWRNRAETWSELKILIAGFALPIAAMSLPWIIKAAWYTGNPFYPFLQRWFGAPEWSPGLTAQFATWQAGIGMGRGWTDYALLPFRVILMGDWDYAHFSGKLSVLWIAMLPLAFLGTRNALVRRCLAVSGLYFAIWSASSQQIRFLIPVLPFLAVASAVTLDNLLERVRSNRLRGAVAISCLLITGTIAIRANVDDYRNAGTQWTYLRENADNPREGVVAPVYRFIDEKLPTSARLLCLNTNQGFYLNREYVADSFFEASQIVDWLRPAANESEIRARLDQYGITHILATPQSLDIPYPPLLIGFLSDPAQVRVAYRSPDNHFVLLELSPQGRGVAGADGE